MHILGCAEVAEAIGDFWCCESCHEDVDYGFPLPSVEFNGHEAWVCCGALDAIDHKAKLNEDHV